MESYVERPPLPELAGVVRTVWIQRTGEAPYVQRHLPTGGVEMHFPIGGHPQLVGPLTGPEIEVIPAHTTIVGIRFRPGTAPPLPAVLDDLVDQRLGLAELWRSSADRLVEAMARAGTPRRALMFLQAHLVQEFRSAVRADPLVGEAVAALMPWHPVNIDTLATHLALSASQLRRRCLHAVGMSPKVLQRTLRFQGFLALAQAGATASGQVFSAHAVSADGYISGRTPDGEEEFGRGLGDAPMLFDWYFDGDTPSRVFDGFKLSEPSARFFDAIAARVGAAVAGRTTYEHSGHWGGGGPHPTARLFVLSHRPAPEISEAQTLVTSGIEDAIAAARAAAGDKDVALMGGGLVTEALKAGLVDELVLHQMPVLLGAGRRFFQELPEHVQLRLLEAIPAPGVTHLHYEVVR